MALKSAAERLSATLNGEDFDQETPSIDVEINVIQKEVEAEEAADDYNETSSELDSVSETINQAEDVVEQTEMLINILRTDGINPTALKIISSNPVYTNTWKIGLPSCESLDTVGTNRTQAEQIAASLEAKKEGAIEKVKSLYRKVIDYLKELIQKWFQRSKYNSEKCLKLINELKSISDGSIDSEKLSNKSVKVLQANVISFWNTGLGKVLSGDPKDISEINEAEKQLSKMSDHIDNKNKVELKGKDILNYVKDAKLQEAVKSATSTKDALDATVKAAESAASSVSGNFDKSDKEKEFSKTYIGYVKKKVSVMTKAINAMQSSFITAGVAVVACKKKDNK